MRRVEQSRAGGTEGGEEKNRRGGRRELGGTHRFFGRWVRVTDSGHSNSLGMCNGSFSTLDAHNGSLGVHRAMKCRGAQPSGVLTTVFTNMDN
eukprot:5792392-Pleurochrysis_carterae.AAC.2